MRFMIKYQGFTAEIETDEKKGLLMGKIIDIPDVVTFQGRTAEEIRAEFYNAVDNYIRWLDDSIIPLDE
jgi:predicted HicB family RNase H-like nuclease